MRYDKARRLYAEYQKSQVKETSYISIEQRLGKYCDPFFKGERLPLKVKRLIEFKAYLKAQPIADSYKRSIYTNLAMLLNFAYRMWGIEPTTRRVQNFKKPLRKLKQTWSEDEYERLRPYIVGKMYKALIDLLFYGGLRRGEAMALMPSDITKDGVTITKTYTRRKLTSPKTPQSNRKVILPDEIIEELREQATRKQPHERIFDDTSYTTLKRKLDQASRKAKEPTIRVHDLRHSHITNLLYEGFTPQGIAKRVGHSDVETLFNVYAETRDKENERIARRLDTEIKRERKLEPKRA
jgi:integrase